LKTGIGEAALLTIIMAAVILFCRICPFLFFRGRKLDANSEENSVTINVPDSSRAGVNRHDGTSRRTAAFLVFVEKIVPPLAMTVLTFNALTAPIFENIRQSYPVQSVAVLAAATLTVLVHLWRRNPLLSIFGGTAVFMVMERLLGN